MCRERKQKSKWLLIKNIENCTTDNHLKDVWKLKKSEFLNCSASTAPLLIPDIQQNKYNPTEDSTNVKPWPKEDTVFVCGDSIIAGIDEKKLHKLGKVKVVL